MSTGPERVHRLAALPILMAMTVSNLCRSFDHAKLYDLTMRLPIVAYSLALLVYDVAGFRDQAREAFLANEHLEPGFIIAGLARISQLMFLALLAGLHLTRLRPVAKSQGILPRLIALVAVCVPPLFLLLDRAPPALGYNLVSVLAILAANVMAAVTLTFLGRSLSIMPEARRLVTGGPYALVRHPLYFCEILAVVAFVLQYRSIAATLLALFAGLLQVARAAREESVLARAFPEFASYRLRTPFLIPRDPGRFFALFVEDPTARRRSVAVVTSTVGLLALALILLPLPLR